MAKLEEIADRFEIPACDVRLTIAGSHSVLVENHRGIAEYGPGRVTLRAPGGEVRIDGEALTLDALNKDALLVSGRIFTVNFV